MATKTLLTAQELADLCRVPLATIYKWSHAGTGPRAIKVGRHLRFREDEVERWLDLNTAESETDVRVVPRG